MIRDAFVKNRTEEFDQDIWSDYVLPLYYSDLGLKEARKSCVLQGGRGCGKTALLRYLCYQSQFSIKRSDIPTEALETIGLYLKADSQYFSGFSGNRLEDRKWRDIFEHALCLALAEQITGSLLALNCSSQRESKFGQLGNLDFFAAIRGFLSQEESGNNGAFFEWLRLQRQLLSRWFKNFDFEQPPTLFPMREFLIAMINELRKKLPYMAQTVFTVYIDEYENLLEYQQKFLNTLIKSGEPPLIFHVATKPNGMRTRATIGTESIQETADFRLINLDDKLNTNFNLFCAELFFFRLIRQADLSETKTPVSIETLRQEDKLFTRLDPEYQRIVLSEMYRILPHKRYSEIAKDIFDQQSGLYSRWKEIVEEGLKLQGSPIKSGDFFDPSFPEASLVCAALLNQKTKTAAQILIEFQKLKEGKNSNFKEGDWIHHLLVGTILLIYLPFRSKPCPIYAGFEAFTKLSGTSVRHFLELCHLSVSDAKQKNNNSIEQISIEIQAQAAARASRTFLNEVSSCGDYGNRLFSLVNFLGKLFRLSQGRYSQSEAERTHFSIIGKELSPASLDIMREALKWSIITEAPETKVKVKRYESSDYTLNPIYAPFFGLSFNKGRKVEIQAHQAETILIGKIEEFTQLLRLYEHQWGPGNVDQLRLDLSSQ